MNLMDHLFTHPKETDDRVIWLREKIWNVLTTFWNRVR